MKTAEARQQLIDAGYGLSDRPSEYFDNEIVLHWPRLGAIGVLCERSGEVDVGEVEAFVRNANRKSAA